MDLEKIIREYITKTVHMSLSTCVGNKPWTSEVHFAYDDHLNLYFMSLLSRRHSQEIAQNSMVSGNIIKQHQPGESPHGIYFEGQASLLESDDDRQQAFEFMSEQQGITTQDLEDAENPDKHQFYKISVKNWYAFGKFGADSNMKHKLEWNSGI